jgi:hypothetical protein
MIGIYLGHLDWFISKTPMNLILGASLLYWNFPPKNALRSWMVWLIVYLIGMIVELIGVNTGLLFGAYHYGENLGIKVFGVPLLIGINWVVLTFLTAHIANRFIKNTYDKELSELRETVARWVVLTATDSGDLSSLVKQALLNDVARLCDFFGKQDGTQRLGYL